MPIEKYCRCCVTNEEWERGIRKEVLELLPARTKITNLEIWACKKCDGPLFDLATRENK